VKKRTDFGHETHHKSRKGRGLRVVEIRCVPTLDANQRLCRAIEILLQSAARDVAEAGEPLPPGAEKRCRRITNDTMENER